MIECPRCAHAWDAPTFDCEACGHAPPEDDGIPLLAPALCDAGFSESEASFLAHAQGDSFWFKARNALLLWALDKFFPQIERLCEVGCGTGYVLSGVRAHRPQLELWGTEIGPWSLQHARELVPAVHWFQADARALPFEGHFDAIAICDVLEHIEADDVVLSTLWRALKPGGGLLITVPQHRWLWSQADVRAGHVRRYTARGLRRVVEAAGFTVEYTSSFVSLLLPLMAASRLRQRDAAQSEVAMNPRLDAVLGRLMAVERAGIRAGLRLPAGGSRLLIARRPA